MKIENRARATAVVLLIAAISIAGQLAFEAFYLPARVTLAGANGVSASLGLANGRGMTIAPSEALAIKRATAPADLRTVYVESESRLPLHEPLPGLVVIYFFVGLLGLPLTVDFLFSVNVALMALSAVMLAREMMHRSLPVGLLAGLLMASFVPAYRLSVTIGYETWEAFMIVVGVVCLLKYQRTNSVAWLTVGGLAIGFGLWVRSYFILYAVAQAILVLWLSARRRMRGKAVLAWAIPVLVLMVCLAAVRDTGPTGTALTRGGFWHSFWAGVGQFENDVIDGFTDWDVCNLASSSGHDIVCDERLYQTGVPYLFQYGEAYNAVLAARARKWIPDNRLRLARNTLGRLWWMAAPGFMRSSRVEQSRIAAITMAAASILLLLLAIVGFKMNRATRREELWILLGSYMALIPLTGYYLIAKVVVAPYFNMLVVASFGLVALWDLMKRHRTETV